MNRPHPFSVGAGRREPSRQGCWGPPAPQLLPHAEMRKAWRTRLGTRSLEKQSPAPPGKLQRTRAPPGRLQAGAGWRSWRGRGFQGAAGVWDNHPGGRRGSWSAEKQEAWKQQDHRQKLTSDARAESRMFQSACFSWLPQQARPGWTQSHVSPSSLGCAEQRHQPLELTGGLRRRSWCPAGHSPAPPGLRWPAAVPGLRSSAGTWGSRSGS